jgi:UDP-glucose 4-epimerase
MRYLITGGAGFIGSHLTDRLIEAGHRVHVLDNLSTGDLGNVRHWRDHDRFSLTIGSVLDEHVLGQCVAECDRVVHLAAAVGVGRIMDKPVETILTNVRGTENVLQLARHHEKKTLVASTLEVYGEGFEDMDRRVPDLSELESAIGYEPRRGMEDILRDVIEHVKTRQARQAPQPAADRVNGSA